MNVYGYLDSEGRIRHTTMSLAEARMNAKMNGGTVVSTPAPEPDENGYVWLGAGREWTVVA